MVYLIAAFGLIGILIFFLFYGTLAYGFVLYKFWYWFILPIFITLPHINYFQSVGIFLFLFAVGHSGGLVYNKEFKKKYVDEELALFIKLSTPWLILLIGYIIHL